VFGQKVYSAMDVEEFCRLAAAMYSEDDNARQEALVFYTDFAASPDSLPVAAAVLKECSDLNPNWTALHILDYWASHLWSTTDIETRLSLREVVQATILDQDRDPVIITSASHLFAKIGLNEFPYEWPTFLTDCQELDSVEPFIAFFEQLDSTDSIPPFRRNHIYRLCEDTLPSLIALTYGLWTDRQSSYLLLNGLLKWAPLQEISTASTIEFLVSGL
jgi:hypothetical protein